MYRQLSILAEVIMSRVQLALNVSNLDAAIDFYSKLFATSPAKLMPGYANFAIAEPPLKLVLIESGPGREGGVSGALNHLGVEVGSADEVHEAAARLSGQAWALRLRDRPLVATPSRTRSGYTTLTGHLGRSTRSSPMHQRPPV
jgi:catechol 2,3-dioxygenase-like lactoylglutathione lyase family enzyme